MSNALLVPGVYVYTPEMNQEEPKADLKLSIGFYGANYIQTKNQLKGRGITLINVYEDQTYRYRVTNLALDKLKTQYSISSLRYLD